MQAGALQFYGIAPSIEQLEHMIEASGLICPTCGKTMLLDGEPRADLLTLQHDRSGSLNVLCFSCNRRHAEYPGDEFYRFYPNYAFCFRCKALLPVNAFHRNKSLPSGRQSTCPACGYILHRDWKRKQTKENHSDYQKPHCGNNGGFSCACGRDELHIDADKCR